MSQVTTTLTESPRLPGLRRLHPGHLALWTVAILTTVWPVLALLIGTFWDNNIGAPANWGFGAFERALTSPRFGQALLTTALYCAIVVPVSMLLALFLSVIGSFSNARGRRLITPVMIICYSIPAMFYAIGYALVGSGRAGSGNDLYMLLTGSHVAPFNFTSFWGLIFVSVLRSTTFAYILLIGPVSTLGKGQDEAARIFGARPGLRFWMILASLKPAFIATAVLVTIASVQVFDAVYILGTSSGVHTLSTLTYSFLNQQYVDFPGASAVGSMLLGLVVILILIQNRATRDGRFTTVAVKPEAQLRLDLGPWRVAVDLFLALWALFAIVVPVVSLAVTSLIRFPGVYDTFSLANYATVWTNSQTYAALRTTAILATLGSTAAVAFALAMINMRKRLKGAGARSLLDIIMLAPKVMHGIVTAVAFIWAVTLFAPTRELYGTVWLLFLALTVSVIPVAYMLMSGAFAQLDPALDDAARMSGDTPVGIQLRVQIPLLAPSLINAWFLCAVAIAGALDVPLVLGSASLRVVASTVFEYFTFNGNYGASAAMLMLTLLIFAATALVLHVLVLLIRPDLRAGLIRRLRPGPKATRQEIPA